MAAGHAELLALAQKIAFCECWNQLLWTYIRLVNLSLKGLTKGFGDYLTGSEYMLE